MAYTIGSLASLINQKSKSQSNVNKLFNKITSANNVEIQYREIPAEGKKRKVEEKLLTKRKKFKVDNEDSDDDSPKVERKSKKQVNKINAERRIMESEVKKEKESNPDEDSRTIFIGNLPCTIKVAKLKKLFKKYGEVESARLRCAPVANLKIPKRVAVIKRDFHPERSSIVGYVRFVSEDDAIKALEANGMVHEDHHLRVDLASNKNKPHDQKKAVFVGNLYFGAEENDLWKIFESCGPIESIRIIRDSLTGFGKGFCYVNFKDLSSVELALKLDGHVYKDRPLRITKAVKKLPQKVEVSGKKVRKRGPRKKSLKERMQFKVKNVTPEENEDNVATDMGKVKKSKKKVSLKKIIGKEKVKTKRKEEEEPAFQGSKGDESGKKKKTKLSKDELKKKVLAFQLQLKKMNCGDYPNK
ncbi:hypothetical protein J437_LFUL003581 [Ladona fulva]|uniref:RRM domain-containing protein n=1 Tax=Ladona fulva TaxID=123851 RepID=A0A8K0JWN9_LADFU|nr:hypothetical protein J437_LFUL003581 [Ladona fulva]